MIGRDLWLSSLEVRGSAKITNSIQNSISVATLSADQILYYGADLQSLIDSAGDTGELELWSSTAQGSINALETSVGNLESWATTAQGDIAALETWSDTAQGDIAALESWSTTAQGDIDALELAVATLAEGGGEAPGIAEVLSASSVADSGQSLTGLAYFSSSVCTVNSARVIGAFEGNTVRGRDIQLQYSTLTNGDLWVFNGRIKYTGSLTGFGSDPARGVLSLWATSMPAPSRWEVLGTGHDSNNNGQNCIFTWVRRQTGGNMNHMEISLAKNTSVAGHTNSNALMFWYNASLSMNKRINMNGNDIDGLPSGTEPDTHLLAIHNSTVTTVTSFTTSYNRVGNMFFCDAAFSTPVDYNSGAYDPFATMTLSPAWPGTLTGRSVLTIGTHSVGGDTPLQGYIDAGDTTFTLTKANGGALVYPADIGQGTWRISYTGVLSVPP